MWKDQRPAVAKAVRRVQRFLEGDGIIEVYHYDKLYKSMGSKLMKLKRAKFTVGDLGWINFWAGKKRDTMLGTCLTNVYVCTKGEIANDWLVDGNVITKPQDEVKKRR